MLHTGPKVFIRVRFMVPMTGFHDLRIFIKALSYKVQDNTGGHLLLGALDLAVLIRGLELLLFLGPG